MSVVEEVPELLPGYMDLADLEAPIRRESLFGRHAPLEIEVGTGRGDFLLGYAAAHPEHDFLGVERKLVYLRRTVNKIRRDRRDNVRLLNVEGRNLIANYFPPGSIHAIHIYFPDPWPKARHRGRRIIRPDMLDVVIRALEPGGFLHLRTDHGEYFGQMLKVLAAQPSLKPIEPPAELAEFPTAYEDRFLRMGMPIYRASYCLEDVSVKSFEENG